MSRTFYREKDKVVSYIAREHDIKEDFVNCPICLNSVSSEFIRETNCGHRFCNTCLKKHFTDKLVLECAICRTKVTTILESKKSFLKNEIVAYDLTMIDPESKEKKTRIAYHIIKK